MATIQPTTTWIAKGVAKVVWANMANGDIGGASGSPSLPDKSVQVKGTPGAGFTAVFEGSADAGITYETLTEANGTTDLTYVAADVTAGRNEAILENTEMYRPRVTAGDGTTSVTFTMIAEGARR